MNKQLQAKIQESLASVAPITLIVLLLSLTLAPTAPGVMLLFLFGAVLLVVGMGFFTLGVDMSMIPMGEGVGVQLSRCRRLAPPLLACFLLGAVITIAEPDLQVLATQVPAIPNRTLIFTVAAGVGVFLMVAQLRTIKKLALARLLLVFYAGVFILAFFAPDSFIPVSFDSGGVTTGPITVPFIMALGIGMASVRSDKHAADDSFGLVALCSIGPILSVLLLGIFYQPSSASYTPVAPVEVATTRQAGLYFAHAFPDYFGEVALALAPIALLFLGFQLATRRFKRHQLLRICVGLVYAYLGLVLFLTGVNVGFMPAGQYIGGAIGGSSYAWVLVPAGMLIGYYIVKAEPAVQVLNKQVEEISNGRITQKAMLHSLSLGVAASVGIAMLRILTGVSILWFLIPGYAISLALTFFVPPLFTAVAFDSGGVASGPMTATFLLPFAMGACEALGGNILTDAFGIVAMVAMTPLVTIQLLGLSASVGQKVAQRRIQARLERTPDTVSYFDFAEVEP